MVRSPPSGRLPLPFVGLEMRVLRFPRRHALVNDRPDGADHPDGIRGLPDVPAHVHPDSPGLDRLRREFEGIHLRLELRPARYDKGYGTALDDLLEVGLAVVRLDEVCAELRPHPPPQTAIPGIPLLELLADRGDGYDGHAPLLPFLHHAPEVRQTVVLVRRAD